MAPLLILLYIPSTNTVLGFMLWSTLSQYCIKSTISHWTSPADKKNYCDRVDQSMKLGMQVRFGINNSIRRGAKKISYNFLKCEILINS